MNGKTETTKKQPIAAETTTEPQTVQVLTRFERAELDALRNETGATSNATAVACFVRKNLRKRA